MKENKKIGGTALLVAYQLLYVVVLLWVLPTLAVGETLNAAVTAAMTVLSAILIGKTYFEEREKGSARRSLGILSLCALVTVYVLYECGLYS